MFRKKTDQVYATLQQVQRRVSATGETREHSSASGEKKPKAFPGLVAVQGQTQQRRVVALPSGETLDGEGKPVQRFRKDARLTELPANPPPGERYYTNADPALVEALPPVGASPMYQPASAVAHHGHASPMPPYAPPSLAAHPGPAEAASSAVPTHVPGGGPTWAERQLQRLQQQVNPGPVIEGHSASTAVPGQKPAAAQAIRRLSGSHAPVAPQRASMLPHAAPAVTRGRSAASPPPVVEYDPELDGDAVLPESPPLPGARAPAADSVRQVQLSFGVASLLAVLWLGSLLVVGVVLGGRSEPVAPTQPAARPQAPIERPPPRVRMQVLQLVPPFSDPQQIADWRAWVDGANAHSPQQNIPPLFAVRQHPGGAVSVVYGIQNGQPVIGDVTRFRQIEQTLRGTSAAFKDAQWLVVSDDSTTAGVPQAAPSQPAQ